MSNIQTTDTLIPARYQPNIRKDHYDVVIIGSGVGGLVSGLLLAKEGYEVCILEKNRQYGGCLQIFSRDKTILDTGVHYLGGLSPGQNLYQYFDYLGILSKLNLIKMNEDGFDLISYEDDHHVYPLAMGHDHFIDRLSTYFPNEVSALIQYTDALKSYCASFPLYSLQDDVRFSWDKLSVGLYPFIQNLTSDQRLRNVLLGNHPLYVLDRDRTPFYVHALISNSYIESAYKCVDGGGQIAHALVQAFKQAGGEIYNYAEVTSIEVDQKTIKSITINEHQQLSGRRFISNLHPATLASMMPSVSPLAHRLTDQMKYLSNSCSSLTLHLIFKEKAFPYLDHNRYHHYTQPGQDNRAGAAWPTGLYFFTPADSRCLPYASSIHIMTLIDYQEVAPWVNTMRIYPYASESRSAAYDEWKLQKAELIMQRAEQLYPGMRSATQSMIVTSPLSYRDYIHTPEGSIYGLMKDYTRPFSNQQSAHIRASNLYQTGQNTNLHGILGTTVSGFKTAMDFIGDHSLIKRVMQL